MPPLPHADIIPTLAQLPRRPKRIILHWTGGGYHFNAIDKRAYHYGVEVSGQIRKGVFGVRHNLLLPLKEGSYAKHTGGFNGNSVGVSFCGMRDAVRGGSHGPAPLREDQVAAGLRFVAELCAAWGLSPTRDQVFTHMEAWTIHKVKGQQNHLKWDIAVLPFRPDLAEKEVGPWLRDEVKRHLAALGA